MKKKKTQEEIKKTKEVVEKSTDIQNQTYTVTGKHEAPIIPEVPDQTYVIKAVQEAKGSPGGTMARYSSVSLMKSAPRIEKIAPAYRRR